MASVSKPLTSTLVHRLQQDGGASTSDTLAQHLDLSPQPGQTADAMLGGITIRNLLEHLAGFNSPQGYGYDPVFNDAAIVSALGTDYPVLKSHIRTFMNGKALANAPGTTYNYSQGWSVRDYGNGNRNTWHNGSLPGTTSWVVRFQNGYNYAAAFNRRNETSPGSWLAGLTSKMNAAHDQVAQWPDHDLFPSTLSAAPESIGARYAGSWYDVTHDGEGFVVQIINPRTAVVYWFTYDSEGRAAWMLGITSEGTLENGVDIGMLRPEDGNFGVAFDPARVVKQPNGELILKLTCGSGSMSQFTGGSSGFPDVNQALTRLAGYVNPPCP